jgi:hypothetical protein
MSQVYCGVCDRNVMEDCECETVSRAKWEAARREWIGLRRYVAMSAANGALDEMFFTGETVPSCDPAPHTDSGEDSCA